MKLLESSPKMSEIESRLAKHTFLSRNNLPGYLDGCIFLSLQQSKGKKFCYIAYPDRNSHPNFYHWYILMRQFAPLTIRSWIDRRLYYQLDDTLLHALFPNASSPHKPDHTSKDDMMQTEVADCKQKIGTEGLEGCYMIDVLLKEESNQAKEQLLRCLEGFG